MEEYRDVHGSVRSMQSYYERIQRSTMSEKQKRLIAEFVTALKIGKAGQKVKSRRILNYLQFLLKLHGYFGKDLESISEEDTTRFYLDLQENGIRRQNGMPYALASKDEYVKALKRYLGWIWGKDSSRYRKSLSWMKEAYKKSDKQAITLEQARDILRKEEYVRNRCLFIMLFDSGARIEELLNIRLKDVVLSEDNSFYMIHLRGKKTELAERKVSVPLSAEELTGWLREHPTGNSGDYLFPLQYDNSRKIIGQMSAKCLTKPVRPHELRHSSATHYIQVFGAENIGGFYYRYGWKYGSKEAETYIKTHLFGGEQGQRKVVQAVGSERIIRLEDENRVLNKELEHFTQGSGILSILTKLIQRQDELERKIANSEGKAFDIEVKPL
jgi:integrase